MASAAAPPRVVESASRVVAPRMKDDQATLDVNEFDGPSNVASIRRSIYIAIIVDRTAWR